MSKSLNVEETVKQVIQTEIKELVYYDGAPYIKFLLISSAIEFLGACMDNNDFESEDHSEDRFKDGLSLFRNNAYIKYNKKSAPIFLYKDLRCGMVHKLKPSNKVRLTQQKHWVRKDSPHLTEKDGSLILVLEEFYEDLNGACEELLKRNRENRLPSKKLNQDYIKISDKTSGDTKTNKGIIT